MKITPTGGGGRTKASGAGMRYSSGRLDSFIHPRGGPGDRAPQITAIASRSGRLESLRVLGEQAMSVDHCGSEIYEFAVV